jgi:LmbE family N-acetylglucosaminyl deacetylase
VTSGDVGIARPDITRAEAAALREAEQLAAAAVVGVHDVVFLREPDGSVVNTLDLRKRLVREIRRFQPEAVICSDPSVFFVESTYINHPDHRAVAAAALDAIFPAAGQPHVFEELAAEGLKAHKVRKVFVEGWGGGDTWINVTDVIDLKIEALRKHTSQLGDWEPDAMVRQWSKEAGKGKEMEYAESYRVMTIVSDEDWAKRSAS